MAKLLFITGLLLAFVGAALPFAALVADKSNGVDAEFIKGYADAAEQSKDLKRRQALYSQGDEPASFYGEPISHKPLRIVKYDTSRLETAADGPAKGKTFYRIVNGETPMQSQTAFDIGKKGAAGLLFGAGLLIFAASFFAKRRGDLPVPTAA
jgi:hypothetical protein